MAGTQAGASAAEIEKFGRLAPRWWDVNGPMRPLHRMNDVRVRWIDAQVAGRAADLLDIGCGAGIAAEALAKRGYHVTGLDAAAEAIAVARLHADQQGLVIEYRCGVASDLAADGLSFGAVTALEVIEHVPDQAGFMAELGALTRPGGRVFVSTLNRTLRSLAVAKIGAEYVARLLPRGTHDWQRFVPPDALAAYGRAAGLRLTAISGMTMSLLDGAWSLTSDLGINYIAAFEKPWV
jgi:2-polyprenyl-6-hydroxyphenyl methylase/3-demethylubiquinone-9 3-methyltransferase